MLFGASDLIARGTSLLAMFPNSITTSVANLKRRLVHVKAALIIGLVAAVTAPFGTWIAGAVSPRVGSILFACYLCVLLIRSLFVAVKATRSARALPDAPRPCLTVCPSCDKSMSHNSVFRGYWE